MPWDWKKEDAEAAGTDSGEGCPTKFCRPCVVILEGQPLSYVPQFIGAISLAKRAIPWSMPECSTALKDSQRTKRY
jgi:hypothetical protein